MAWRLAGSLTKLRDQINNAYPNRNKASDGTIGDTAHQAQGSSSDHNPNGAGVVTAMDITNDPASGADVQKIADSIIASRDPRVKYLIFNDRIMIPADYGWQWVFHYEGSHRQHLHVSVYGDYDNTNDWSIGGITMSPQAVNLAYAIGYNRQANKGEIEALTGKSPEEVLQTIYNNNEAFRARADQYESVVKLLDQVQKKVSDPEANKKLDQIREILK